MRELEERQKIGNWNGVELTVDFDDLFRYKGGRSQKDDIDSKLGNIFTILSGLVLAVSMFLLINSEEFRILNLLVPPTIDFALPYLSIPLLLYGLYLRRDKNEFNFNLEEPSLIKTKMDIARGKISVIEIENYFSEDIKAKIDEIQYKHHNDFLRALSGYLISKKINTQILIHRLGVNPEKIIDKINGSTPVVSLDQIYARFFLDAFDLAIKMNIDRINDKVLLTIFCKYIWKDILLDLDVTSEEIDALVLWLSNEITIDRYNREWKRLSKLKPTGSINLAYTSRATPVLDSISKDYTSIVAKSDFEISMGKEDVLAKTIQYLQIQGGNAVLLHGPSGIGKTQLLKHLATEMVLENVPSGLRDKRLLILDLNKVMAVSTSINEFENKLSKALEEAYASGNIILVFEDIGQIFKIRAENKSEVVNLLSTFIDQSKLQVIVTSTTDSLERYIRNDQEFVSKFNILEIKEPKFEIALQILLEEVPKLEKEHGVSIRFEAIKQIAKIAPRLSHEKVMPDKGLDILEEIIIYTKAKNLTTVDSTIVGEVLSEKTGVNVGQITDGESELLQNLEERMHGRVIGQETAIKSVAAAIRRNRSGFGKQGKPVASFLFYGPTGVGKTEVAKTLADTYYGSEKMMIRLDMSEFQENNNIPRLIGYTDTGGNFVGGVLTEQIRSKPFSLVLLDEIEKANPKVLDLFLQILDEANVTDGMGRNIDFSNTIIIATSNVASKSIADYLSKGLNYRQIEQNVKSELMQNFRVEFLNRFDKTIMFKSLSKPEIEQITHLLLAKLNRQMEDSGIAIHWTNRTAEQLAGLGYNPVYGAREINRTIQEYVEDQISKKIISREIKSGNHVYLDGLNIVKIE